MHYRPDQQKVNLNVPVADLLLPMAAYTYDVRPAAQLAPFRLSHRERRLVESELLLHAQTLQRRLEYLFPLRGREIDEMIRQVLRPYQASHDQALGVILNLIELDRSVHPLVGQKHQADLSSSLVRVSLDLEGQARAALFAALDSAYAPIWSLLRQRSAHALEAQLRAECGERIEALLVFTDVYPELRLWPSIMALGSVQGDGEGQALLRGWLRQDNFWIMPPAIYHDRAWIDSVHAGLRAIFLRAVNACVYVFTQANLTGREQILARQAGLAFEVQLLSNLSQYIQEVQRAH